MTTPLTPEEREKEAVCGRCHRRFFADVALRDFPCPFCRANSLTDQLAAAEERAREAEAIVAAMEYGDELLLELLASRGMKADKISTGIVKLAEERNALAAQVEKLREAFADIGVRV